MTPEIWLQFSEMTCVWWFYSMHQSPAGLVKLTTVGPHPSVSGFSRSGVEPENQPAMQETPAQFLDREDPLEKG